MEQLYQDFTTKLLPQIQAGLVITKEYFMDLFARDIQYLIVTDTFWAIVSFILVTITGIIFFKTLNKENFKKVDNYEGGRFLVLWIMSGFVFIISILCLFNNTSNIIKDKYIPEIRIYEQIQSFKN